MFSFFRYFILMCISVLSVCMCTTCLRGGHQTRVSDPLELKSWIVENYHVGAGN